MSGALFSAVVATTVGSSGPTYTLSTADNVTSVDEGADLTFYVNTTNVEDGTTLYVYVGSTGTYDISSRFSNGTGTAVAIYSNVGSFTENVSADHTTATGTQKYSVVMSTTASPPTFVGNTVTITVNDTSQSYAVPTIFDLVNPPSTTGYDWVDSADNVGATINGSWGYESTHGGGITLVDGYIEIQGGANTNATFTLSMAADFGTPQTSHWAPVFSGGSLGPGNQDIFAYVFNNTITVGTGNTPDYGGATLTYTGISGLAWWDFVYDGTSVELYKNGALVGSATLSVANAGWSNPLWFGMRHGSSGDILQGTFYQIVYQEQALNLSEIVSQYNSQASTYGLTPINSSPTLVSIAVTPSTPNVDSSITTSLQMTATGTYSDSSTQDLTSSATWTIDTSSASINSTGLITIPSNDVESGTVSATVGGVTGTTAITIHGAQIPTGSVTGQWNNAGTYGGNPQIWGDAGGYQWAKVYNPSGITPAVNGTIGSDLDGSTSYIQTPIHMQGGQHEFTFGFTATMNPGSTFPAGIFDCSHPGGNTGLRAYWSDSTHITITEPGTATAGIDISQFNINFYVSYFWTIRMTLNTIANTGEIDIFVNGVKCASSTSTPYNGNGFQDAAGIYMILGALYNGDNSAQQNFLPSIWFNFIYYDRALSDSEVSQLYRAQHANLLAPTPPTTYSFHSGFSAASSSYNILIDIGANGFGPTVPPDSMGGWTVTGPGITGSATVQGITSIINDSQFYVTIDQSIYMAPGTYTFTAP
jgi:hypothetical protein